ncbi:MAG: PilZ domain-containing protein [Acidobacteria bacterium]|nr:PilZ domain-containing protein [Acidobacteriota bacterium]MBS1866111.1 PilZ domain-containing protein [Acidobacteriota bacterium]
MQQHRQHARVRLRLPVRLRWVAPLGQQSEVCETRNVSRGGLLVECKERHGEGFPLWVTFPFDASAPEGQPEVLARVVRARHVEMNGASGEEIALHFEGIPKQSNASNGHRQAGAAHFTDGRSVALPIRVRPRHILWFEEAMTVEVSADRVRFVSNREYPVGEALLVTFVSPDTKPWPGSGEMLARIVNVEKLPHSSSLVVTLMRLTD